MALNNCSICGGAKTPHQLNLAAFKPSSFKLNVNLKHDSEKWCKWGSSCLRVSAPRAMASSEENGKPNINGVQPARDRLAELEEYLYSVNFSPKPVIANSPDLLVSYKGIPGSYGEEATLKAFPDCQARPCEDFDTAFMAVESWIVDAAIVPIESSVGGSIHRNYDLLLRHKLHIIGEVQLLVKHCLLGLAGAKKEELKGVMSHPMALVQCKKQLSRLNVTNVNVDDTAEAAKIVALGRDRTTGAIASARAAEIYGLDVLAETIQDDKVNVARFLILGRNPVTPGTDKPYKTSIVFSLEGGNGALFKALAAFSMRNINLTKIESRPLKQKLRPFTLPDDSIDESDKYFEYLFYIDFEASMAEPRAKHAIANLKEYTKFVRVLGCYPAPEDINF